MVGLASSLVLQANNFLVDMHESVKEKKFVEERDLALKAKELHPDNPDVYIANAIYSAQGVGSVASTRATLTRKARRPRHNAPDRTDADPSR